MGAMSPTHTFTRTVRTELHVPEVFGLVVLHPWVPPCPVLWLRPQSGLCVCVGHPVLGEEERGVRAERDLLQMRGGSGEGGVHSAGLGSLSSSLSAAPPFSSSSNVRPHQACTCTHTPFPSGLSPDSNTPLSLLILFLNAQKQTPLSSPPPRLSRSLS